MKNLLLKIKSLFKRKHKEDDESNTIIILPEPDLPKQPKVKKQRKNLTSKQKKKIVGAVAATICSGSVLTVALFTAYPNWFGNADQSHVTTFYVAFCLGFFFVLWYPATRLIAWMKTRKLKNLNLEKDLELKDAKIEALNKDKITSKDEV